MTRATPPLRLQLSMLDCVMESGMLSLTGPAQASPAPASPAPASVSPPVASMRDPAALQMPG